MTNPIECLRCKTAMLPGFIADMNASSFSVQEKWSPGEPVVSFWTGLHVDKKKAIPVSTLRCPKCGMLESYANPA